MKLNSKIVSLAVASMMLAGPAWAEWPEKTITLIVPWGAGGATDQVTRVVAGELEAELGQKIVVVNQAGASGSIGSKAALDAPADGYTWTAGAAKDLGTYAVTGLLDTSIKDWDLYLNSALVNVISVNEDSDIQDMAGFIEALKAGGLTVGTSGVNSAGHSAMEQIIAAAGGSYKHISYDGGANAVLSTVSGETAATSQLITEQVDMLRAKKLRPLAVLSTEAADVPGIGTIPAITDVLPDFKPTPIYFGVFMNGAVPDEVKAKMEAAWTKTLASSDALDKYIEGRGSLLTLHVGEDAQERVWNSIKTNAWLMQDSGKAAVSPDTVGIPRP
jgi:tripartite-type tricarboxylate transporter receptor subunit TctC